MDLITTLAKSLFLAHDALVIGSCVALPTLPTYLSTCLCYMSHFKAAKQTPVKPPSDLKPRALAVTQDQAGV